MIWYLLYPFSGTTEPPRISPNHRVRKAFQAHGTATASHWLLSILLTVVISVLLCYPAVFQTDSPAAAGLRSLPRSVWTSTAEIHGDRPADVEIRQVWVHGHYMNAIDTEVLHRALYVQDALVGSGFGEGAGTALSDPSWYTSGRNECTSASAHTWGYHSPLMYWNCSSSVLDQDLNILATINSRAKERSALNITMRPSTLFAGKAFHHKKLQAADALVISLFDRANSSLAAPWEERSTALTDHLSSEWTIYPPDGKVSSSRLYEFRFEPFNYAWHIGLGLLYLFSSLYLINEIMRLKTLKSWFGLLITIGAKVLCSIAGFTLCTYLGGRLIDEVLQHPPEMEPTQRIGNAVGAVGHLALLNAAVYLFLIYLTSLLLAPFSQAGVDFCIFLAVTLVLDLVYHFTFFLAVLSVEVRRLELLDSLVRADQNQNPKSGRQPRQSWLAALKDGALPLSTRFAGSAAIVSLILALQWHFFGSASESLSLRGAFDKMMKRQARATSTRLPWAPSPIHQARTPAEWLTIQDHRTARELFDFIKPNAHVFVARVFDPLLVVLKGAEGRDTSNRSSSLIQGLRRLAREHAFPAALMMVFLIAGVTLLMNYLLWSGLPEVTDEENDEDTVFSANTLPTSQTLDIVRLDSCSKGHVVSVSLDRSTSLWINDYGRNYKNITFQTSAATPNLWPVVASAFDGGGNFLALCADNGHIGLYTLVGGRFLPFPTVDLRGHAPVLFSFTTIHSAQGDKLRLIVLTPDGYLTEIDAESGVHQTKQICASHISSATLFTCTKNLPHLVYVNRTGQVHILPLTDDGRWTPDIVAGLDPGPPPSTKPAKIKYVYPCSSLGIFFVIRTDEAEVVDFQIRAVIHTLQIGQVKFPSFRVLHSARRICACGSSAVRSLSLAYTEQDTDHMIMQTFTLDETANSQICLGKPFEKPNLNCRGLDRATDAVHCVDPAGVWESTNAQSVLGIRRCPSTPTPASSSSAVDAGYFTSGQPSAGTALKLRAMEGKHGKLFSSSSPVAVAGFDGSSDSSTESYEWEMWTLSTSGEFQTKPLVDREDLNAEGTRSDLNDQLFVASAGPITRLGKKSVAVGFGNTVKIITLGKEAFGIGVGADDGTLNPGVYKSRTRKGGGRKTQ
ncbi:hypothetical protein BCR34DRAFT_498499 [Clohesyomyces aquaticus]|uniref:SSD domain-containing protein n=1 Tax=Clohesyomyces aquaticus TaxID=1231657 RepID=A0A1Y1YBS6_9PLEO|nr:hypothetical protein BCR34DRAFT_498499 [Clohesyomyces aquaticus]